MSYLDATFSARDFGMKKDFYNCRSPSRTSIDSLKPASETENDINRFIISKFGAFDFSSEFCDKLCVIPAESPVHNPNNAAIKDGFDYKYQSTKECSSMSQSNIHPNRWMRKSLQNGILPHPTVYALFSTDMQGHRCPDGCRTAQEVYLPREAQ